MTKEMPLGELVRAMSGSNPTSVILRALTVTFGGWSALVTPSGHIIEANPHDEAETDAIAAAVGKMTSQNRHTLMHADEDGRTVLVAAVGRDRRPVALLVVVKPGPFDAEEYRFATGAASLLGYVMHDVRRSKAASRVVRECVARLVFAGHLDGATELAADLGLAAPPTRPHVVCIRGLDTCEVDYVLDVLEAGLPRGNQHLLAYSDGEELWMLVGPAQFGGVEREARRLHAKHGWSLLLSERVDAGKLPYRRESWARVIHRRPLGSLLDVSRYRGPSVSDWVKTLETEGGPDVLAAVVEYLRHRGRWESAAEALSIHRNTLRYRIATARRLIDADLEDPDVTSRLWLTLRDAGWTA